MSTSFIRSTFRSLFVCILITTSFTWCRKNDVINQLPDKVPADKEIIANISGRVLNEEHFPIHNASVTIGSATAQTNELGEFSFNDVKLMQRNGFIQIQKEGYYKGLKTLTVEQGADNRFEIKLLSRTLTGSFDASAGGIITVDDGSEIKFETASIVKDADKSTYTGQVKVFAKYIDPTAEDFLQTMPGNLVGKTTNNEEVALISFGMLAVELESETGEKLQLAQGKPATISSEIPATLLSQAQATIPLWYMDEKDGLWKEEGIATKEGSRFKGKVSHFSFWNYDYLMDIPLYRIKARLVNKNNMPVANKKFTIIIRSRTAQQDVTDSTGQINFMGGRDTTLISLWFTPCNNNTATFKVGPFTKDTDLGDLIVDDTSSANILKGRLAVCDSRVLKNGGLLYLYDGSNYLQRAKIDNSGNFTVAESETCLTNKPSIHFKFYNSEFILLKDTTMAFSKGIKDIGSIQSCRQNTPPVVSAGDDQEVALPGYLTLFADASDNDGRIVSYSWVKTSGPAGDNIVTPNQNTSIVTFTTAGTYVYKVTVKDNEGEEASDEVIFKVHPESTNSNNTSTMKINLDNKEFDLAAPADDISATRSGNTTTISGKTGNLRFGDPKYALTYFTFNGNAAPGNYNLSNGSINAGDKSYMIREGTAEVSGYGNFNQYVEGVFTGKVIYSSDTANANATKYPITINFKAIRK